MNETKIIIYVPFSSEKGFYWRALTVDFDETELPLVPGYDWYQIVVDGDKKEKMK